MFGLNKTDFDHQAFYAEVYHIVEEIPAGRVLTYGLIARLAGFPQYSRMVGHALANVPEHLSLPCHRVVNSTGSPSPVWPQQTVLLQQEGIQMKPNGKVDLKKYLWEEVNLLFLSKSQISRIS